MNHSGIIAKEGLPFIVFLAVLTLVSCVFAGLNAWVLFLLLLTLFVVWFFRNPERHIAEHPRQIVSPADGKVIRIEAVGREDRPGTTFLKICIFMNVFNVHINRVPFSGQIKEIRYHAGQFLSANLDKASALNERNTVVIGLADDRELIAVQIAGLIARRIVCWLKEGMQVERGQRLGLIRFGSRVELFLPADTRLLVQLGDKVKAGETPIGELS
ncbi:MAG: phosphatidylserine decarboxylase family protein [Syntrophaceae bacterium]|nr:phosphatidylserine decarboxylase family protein [Syntrophaceae bacterium]